MIELTEDNVDNLYGSNFNQVSGFINSVYSYKKIGFTDSQMNGNFYCRDQSTKSLKLINEEYENTINEINTIQLFSDMEIDMKIKELKVNAENLKVELLMYKSEQYEEIRKVIDKTNSEIDELENSLNVLISRLGEEKANLIPNRIQSAWEELNNLNENFKKILNARQEQFNNEFKSGEEGFKRKVVILNDLLTFYSNAMQKVKNEIDSSTAVWFGPKGSSILYYLSLAGTWLSGGFYSDVAGSGSDNGIFSKILKFLITPIKYFKSDDLVGNLINAGLIILVEVIILGSITALIYFIPKWMVRSREKPNESNYKLELSLNEPEVIKVEATLSTNSFFTFWLNVIPFILISSIFLLIVLVFSDQKSLEDALNNFVRDANGSALNLLGIITISLLFFIKENINGLNLSKIREIILATLGVILLSLIIIKSIWVTDIKFPVVFFVSFTVVSFVGGMFLRYKVLFDSLVEYHMKKIILTNIINYYSRPKRSILFSEERKLLKSYFNVYYQSLMRLIVSKNIVAGRFFPKFLDWIKLKPKNWNVLNKEGKNGNSKGPFRNTNDQINLESSDAAEKYYFPDLILFKSKLEEDLKRSRDKREEADKNLIELTTSDDLGSENLIEKLNVIEKNIILLNNCKIKNHLARITKINELKAVYKLALINYNEGQELGNWYKKN